MYAYLQVYAPCPPSKRDSLCSTVAACLDSINSWLASNRLLLNIDKTAVMWCASRPFIQRLSFPSLHFGTHELPLSSSVKCLGVAISNDVTYAKHISKIVSGCFAVLRRIRSVRRCLTQPLLVTLISSLVLCHIDYCVSILSGSPRSELRKLQSILNASARLTFGWSFAFRFDR